MKQPLNNLFTMITKTSLIHGKHTLAPFPGDGWELRSKVSMKPLRTYLVCFLIKVQRNTDRFRKYNLAYQKLERAKLLPRTVWTWVFKWKHMSIHSAQMLARELLDNGFIPHFLLILTRILIRPWKSTHLFMYFHKTCMLPYGIWEPMQKKCKISCSRSWQFYMIIPWL